jgi:hypothetical protein
MTDLSTLSKSYPYLSLARQLGLSYGDVLLVSDYFDRRGNDITPPQREAYYMMVPEDRHQVCQLTAAVANGEIGHGE